MSDPVVISHDGFARHEVVRQKCTTDAGCSWCGNNYQGHLFQYGHVRDDDPRQRAGYLRGLFCSIECCRSYHDGAPA